MSPLRTKALVWVCRPGSNGGAEVLLLERPARRGGGFHPITGKAEPGETPDEAAAREAAEETGLSGPLVDLHFRHEFAAGRRRMVEHAFLLLADAGAEPVLCDEHVGAAWVAPGEAHARVRWDAHRAALALALAAWELHKGPGAAARGPWAAR